MRNESTRGGDSYSDEELLSVCRDGDTEAFAALWERHRRAGFTAARNLAPSLDADDLVSEAYLRIFELVRGGRGPRGAFRPYLYQVIRSVSADRFRSGEHSAVELHDVPEVHETAPWEDIAFDLSAVSTAFASLTPRWQAALWYTEVEGLPPRDAAVFLGLSPNSTSALAARARDALKSAWVETHVHRELADGDCKFTLEHLQRFQRGKLTARISRQVEAHLAACSACAKAAAEARALNKQLGLVLAWVTLGGVGTGLLAEQLGLARDDGTAAAGFGPSGGAGAGTAEGAAAGNAEGAAAGNAASISGDIVSALGVRAASAKGAGVLAAAAVGVTVVSLALWAASPAPVDVDPVESSVSDPVDDSGDPGDSGADGAPSDASGPSQAANGESGAGAATSGARVGGLGSDIPRLQPPAAPGPSPHVRPTGKPAGNPPVIPPDTGLSWLRVGYECTARGEGMLGSATHYGVLQLRVTVPGRAPVPLMNPAFDPALEGQPDNVFSNGLFTDTRGNTFNVGFFSDTEDGDLHGWYAGDPTLLPNWHTLFPERTLDDVSLEMRLVTPQNLVSMWQPVDTTQSCG